MKKHKRVRKLRGYYYRAIMYAMTRIVRVSILLCLFLAMLLLSSCVVLDGSSTGSVFLTQTARAILPTLTTTHTPQATSTPTTTSAPTTTHTPQATPTPQVIYLVVTATYTRTPTPTTTQGVSP